MRNHMLTKRKRTTKSNGITKRDKRKGKNESKTKPIGNGIRHRCYFFYLCRLLVKSIGIPWLYIGSFCFAWMASVEQKSKQKKWCAHCEMEFHLQTVEKVNDAIFGMQSLRLHLSHCRVLFPPLPPPPTFRRFLSNISKIFFKSPLFCDSLSLCQKDKNRYERKNCNGGMPQQLRGFT